MHVQKFVWMIGNTTDSDARLLQRARSYAQPPEVAVSGGTYEGWRPERRAHRITVEQPTVTIRLKPKVPCVCPVFELTDAEGPLQAVELNGRPLSEEDYTWDGRTLWLSADVTRETALRLSFGGR